MAVKHTATPDAPRGAGTTTSGSGTAAVARWAWIVAIVWSVVAAFAVWHFTRGGVDWSRDFPILALGTLAFPGAALVLLWRAVMATLRSEKFGESTLELDTSPVNAGGSLSGRVRVGRGIAAGAKGTFTLQCQQSVRTKTGPATTRTETRILHETVKPFVVADDVARTGIPFRFDIPAGAHATEGGAQPVEWVLAADIDGGGIGAKMAFGFEVRRVR